MTSVIGVDAASDRRHGAPVSAVELLRLAYLWIALLSCSDAPDDPGGVRCASVAAARLSPPWTAPGAAQAGGAYLLAVARAESTSRPVGVHAGDARQGRTMWAGAVRAGWLDPIGCPGHALAAGGLHGRGWAPRGAWGVAAAYGLRWLGPVGCLLGPAILDVPTLGAIAAAGHARHCARSHRTRDPIELRVCWAGKRKSRAEVIERWRGGASAR